MEVRRKLKRIINLFGIAAKMDLLWLLRDTRYALSAITADTITNLSVISGVWLIAVRFGGIGSMSADEVLFMMSYSTIITGLFFLFGAGNNIHISRIIGRGQLEHLFMQPNSLKVQLFTSGFVPFTGSSNFIIGCILLAISINRLQLQITALWIAKLLFHLTVTMVIIVARAYFVSSAAFYAPVEAEEIASTAIDGTWQLSTFPLSGMPVYIQVSLLTILPEGFMAWYPSLCLLGRPPLGLTDFYPLAYALVLSLAANYIFRKGLNHYVTKGSNRYVPYGFRR